MSNGRVLIIAEAGVNHNGSLTRAKEMIHIAAKAGADAIKFQTFKAENLVSRKAPKAPYQLKTTDEEESQYEMLKKLEFDVPDYQVLMNCCRENNIEFLSTPFDSDSLGLLVDTCKIQRIKIPSGEITNAPFLLQIAETGKPVLLSTGMCTLSDIEMALGILAFGYLKRKEKPSIEAFLSAYISKEGQGILKKKLVLLHCTTEYPAPFDEINLRCMDTLQQVFQLPIGYSDHTAGIAISLAAAARGAVVIEKHFTLDKELPGPDHKASLLYQELKNLVQGIRQIEMALGSELKMPEKSEMKNRSVVRKSLIAKKNIKKGETFSSDNITTKRPGDGVSPIHYWEKLGEKAERDYQAEEKV